MRPDQGAVVLAHGKKITGKIGKVNGLAGNGWRCGDVAARREDPLGVEVLHICRIDGELIELAAGVGEILTGRVPAGGEVVFELGGCGCSAEKLNENGKNRGRKKQRETTCAHGAPESSCKRDTAPGMLRC